MKGMLYYFQSFDLGEHGDNEDSGHLWARSFLISIDIDAVVLPPSVNNMGWKLMYLEHNFERAEKWQLDISSSYIQGS